MTSPAQERHSGSGVSIRAARPDEAAALSELAFRSKAHWGYDAAFMEACREDLMIAAEDIGRCAVYLLEEQEQILGFYRLCGNGDEVTLIDLFLDPAAMGQGRGRRLWQHAVATARHRAFSTLVLQSDPFAEGFYRAMGATRVGESPSTVFPGRMLPVMRLALR